MVLYSHSFSVVLPLLEEEVEVSFRPNRMVSFPFPLKGALSGDQVAYQHP